MIIKGEKKAEKIYRGIRQVIKIYKGALLWYRYSRERAIMAVASITSDAKSALKKAIPLKAFISFFSNTKATLEKAVAGQIKAIGQIFSGASATVKTDAVEKVEADGKAFSGAVATGDAGHTETIKADEISS